MVSVGDTLRFVPTAYIDGPGNGSNGSEASAEKLRNSEVVGMVVQIHEAHRWYRVEYQPRFDRKQYECFKF